MWALKPLNSLNSQKQYDWAVCYRPQCSLVAFTMHSTASIGTDASSHTYEMSSSTTVSCKLLLLPNSLAYMLTLPHGVAVLNELHMRYSWNFIGMWEDAMPVVWTACDSLRRWKSVLYLYFEDYQQYCPCTVYMYVKGTALYFLNMFSLSIYHSQEMRANPNNQFPDHTRVIDKAYWHAKHAFQLISQLTAFPWRHIC